MKMSLIFKSAVIYLILAIALSAALILLFTQLTDPSSEFGNITNAILSIYCGSVSGFIGAMPLTYWTIKHLNRRAERRTVPVDVKKEQTKAGAQ
jgi:uncharacterized membrane protein YraQ (UPF0718 family)